MAGYESSKQVNKDYTTYNQLKQGQGLTRMARFLSAG